jgi:hypothetical protein
LKIQNGDVRIKTWDKDEVYIKTDDETEMLKASQNGNEIKISSNSYASDMEIFIPVQFNLRIASSFGDIIFEGNLTGNIKLSSAGGDITLRSVDGNVDANTQAGDIRTENINGNGKLLSSGGDIKVGNVKGNLELNTLGGDIKIGNVENSLSVSTQGGNIYTGNVAGVTKLKTAGGNIKTGMLMNDAVVHTSGGNINIDGCKGNLEAKTYGGNINISNAERSVNAGTSAGNISLEFHPKEKSKSSLYTTSGNITLFVNESADLKIISEAKMLRGSNTEKIILSDFPSSEFINDKESRKVLGVYIINQPSSEMTVKVNVGTIQIKKLKK